MKILAVIPARYDSKRFPGKPLFKIKDKVLIEWVCLKVAEAKKTKIIDDFVVATDDNRIFKVVNCLNYPVVMTHKDHSSGTDRLVEVVKKTKLNYDFILNIQGDEPLVSLDMIQLLIRGLQESNSNHVVMSTLKKRINKEEDINNPNIVKIVTNQYNQALYFSRHPIPYQREKFQGAKICFKHLGLYGYTREFLLSYPLLPNCNLESLEKLEQLRVLYAGYNINVLETQEETIDINISSDVEKFIDIIESRTNI